MKIYEDESNWECSRCGQEIEFGEDYLVRKTRGNAENKEKTHYKAKDCSVFKVDDDEAEE